MPKRQRLLIITELYPTAANKYLGNFVQKPLERIAAEFEITVLTTHFIWYTKRLQLHQPRVRKEGGITIYSLPTYPWWIVGLEALHIISKHTEFTLNKQRNARRLLAMARRLHATEAFSLVHGHEVYVGDEAAPIATALGIPSLFTLHGVYENHRNNFGAAVVESAIANINGMHKCFSVSKLAANSYTDHGVRQNFQSLPNGISPTSLPDPAAPTHKPSADIHLLSVGFLAPEKRFAMSIRTLAHLRTARKLPATLTIVGEGAQAKELRQLTRELHVAQWVTFYGTASSQDMIELYRNADILVHPSVLESFSMACLEAMTYGCAVVCTSGIGLVEYLRPGTDAIVIQPDDQKALDSAVTELAQSPDRRRALVQAGQETARTLSWENHTRTLTQMYREYA